jgi:type 1 fimbriae regulatory protein FimE
MHRTVMPTIGNGTVPPRRQPYDALRPREYLTEQEVEHLMLTAKRRGRHGHRDATMILLAYRHGLRVGELCALRWDQVEFDQGFLHVRRLKQGIPSVHPLRGPEIRALRQLRRETVQQYRPTTPSSTLAILRPPLSFKISSLRSSMK